MKVLFWVGVLSVVLGVLSFVVPIPHTEREGVSVGDMSIGVKTHHSETIPPIISAAMILGGAGMMIAGSLAGKNGK
jgi:hypothetical protein